MKAVIKNIRITPKKLNLVAEMVRGKSVEDALNLLKFVPKKAAPILYKALYSATKNAEKNNKEKMSNLIIEEIMVGKGMTLKRFQPVSRGRAHPIRKRTSRVQITLSQIRTTKKTEKTAEPEVKAVEPEQPKAKKKTAKKSLTPNS